MTYFCPVCDYGEEESKSLAAVRSHVNAASGTEHDWAGLKDEVEAQAEDADDTNDDQATDQPDQQASSSDDQQDDGEDAPDTSGTTSQMPSQSEYEQQQEAVGDGAAGTESAPDDDTSDDGGNTSNDTSSESGFQIPEIHPMYLLVAVAVLLVLVVLLTRDGESSNEPAEEIDAEREPDNDADGGADEVSLIE